MTPFLRTSTAPRPRRRLFAAAALAFGVTRAVAAQSTVPAITAADLRTRLFLIADDSMGGRATGSRGNYLAAEYIAAEFKRAGLQPAGENGSWFQEIPFFRMQGDPRAPLAAGGTPLRIGKDFIPGQLRSSPRPVDGKRVVYGGSMTDSSTWISSEQAHDRVVVFSATRTVPWQSMQMVLQSGRFASATALALPVLDKFPAEFAAAQAAGRVTTDTSRTASGPGRLYVTYEAADAMMGRALTSVAAGTLGATMHGRGTVDFLPLPFAARNVVAVLPGSDPKLAATYVALTAHSDHVGFDNAPVDHDSLRVVNRVTRPLGADSPPRPPTAAEWTAIRKSLDSLRAIRPPRLDSIRNGADDDGSGTVVLLEVAESLAKGGARPKRSVLFVSHAAEEEGLLGSRWFTDHPTVPRDSIVSEFDMDMVARGNAIDLAEGSPTYLEMIGIGRLSKEYGALIDRANAQLPMPFTFNLTYNQPGHPLQYYCRADHYSYARYDIPAVAISRGEHADYHQVTDEAQYADFDVMARVGQFAQSVALLVGNLDHRPFVDAPKRDPNARCVQ